jgi:hypothetical protein
LTRDRQQLQLKAKRTMEQQQQKESCFEFDDTLKSDEGERVLEA